MLYVFETACFIFTMSWLTCKQNKPWLGLKAAIYLSPSLYLSLHGAVSGTLIHAAGWAQHSDAFSGQSMRICIHWGGGLFFTRKEKGSTHCIVYACIASATKQQSLIYRQSAAAQRCRPSLRHHCSTCPSSSAVLTRILTAFIQSLLIAMTSFTPPLPSLMMF